MSSISTLIFSGGPLPDDDDPIDELLAQWRNERPDLDFRPVGVVGRVARLARVLDREFKEFFAKHGLEKGEWDVLAVLRRTGEPYAVTAGALLKSEMLTSGAVTNRIDRMAAKGLVERVRDGQDRREVRVKLTQHGFELADKLIALHLENEARLLKALPPKALDNLADSLRAALRAVEQA